MVQDILLRPRWQGSSHLFAGGAVLGVLLVAVEQLGTRQLYRREHVLVGVEVGRAPTSPAVIPAPERHHPPIRCSKDKRTDKSWTWYHLYSA